MSRNKHNGQVSGFVVIGKNSNGLVMRLSSKDQYCCQGCGCYPCTRRVGLITIWRLDTIMQSCFYTNCQISKGVLHLDKGHKAITYISSTTKERRKKNTPVANKGEISAFRPNPILKLDRPRASPTYSSTVLFIHFI